MAVGVGGDSADLRPLECVLDGQTLGDPAEWRKRMPQPKDQVHIEVWTLREKPEPSRFPLLLGHRIDLGVPFRQQAGHL